MQTKHHPTIFLVFLFIMLVNAGFSQHVKCIIGYAKKDTVVFIKAKSRDTLDKKVVEKNKIKIVVPSTIPKGQQSKKTTFHKFCENEKEVFFEVCKESNEGLMKKKINYFYILEKDKKGNYKRARICRIHN